MAGRVSFKFRSAISPDSVTFDGAFVSVWELKELIAKRKGLGEAAAYELVISRGGKDLTDDNELLPRNTSVQVRRVPGQRPAGRNAGGAGGPAAAAPALAAPADEFGSDMYAKDSQEPLTREEQDALEQAAINQTASKWAQQVMAYRGRGRGFGRGRGRMQQAALPADYVCNRCGQTGHWKEDCTADVSGLKRVRRPLGLPISMLGASQDGAMQLPDGTFGSLRPNEDTFIRELQRLPPAASQASAAAHPGPAQGLQQPQQQAAVALPTGGGAEAAGGAPARAKPHTNPLANGLLMLDNKPHTSAAAPAAAPAASAEPLLGGATLLSSGLPPALAGEPTLAGDDLFGASDFSLQAPPRSRPGSPQPAPGRSALPFAPQSSISRSPSGGPDSFPVHLLPCGPREVTFKAFDRELPMSQQEFEALQDATRARYNYQPIDRAASAGGAARSPAAAAASSGGRAAPSRSPAGRRPSSRQPSRGREVRQDSLEREPTSRGRRSQEQHRHKSRGHQRHSNKYSQSPDRSSWLQERRGPGTSRSRSRESQRHRSRRHRERSGAWEATPMESGSVGADRWQPAGEPAVLGPSRVVDTDPPGPASMATEQMASVDAAPPGAVYAPSSEPRADVDSEGIGSRGALPSSASKRKSEEDSIAVKRVKVEEQHVQAGTLPRRFVVPLEGIAAPYAFKEVKAEPGSAPIGAETNGAVQQADGTQQQTAAMDGLPSGEHGHQEAAAASPAKESARDRKAHKKHHRRHHKHRSKEHKEKRRHKHQSPDGAAEDSAAQTEGAMHDDADSEVEPLASVTERVLSRFGLTGQRSAGKTSRGNVMDRLGPSKVKRASG